MMANKNPAPQPPNGSSIEVVTQEFLAIDLLATPAEDFATGTLDVDRKIYQAEEDSRRWVVLMTVKIGQEEEHKSPPYVGSVLARGIYEVHSKHPGDPDRLVRITGSSMLYGAVREMLATFTARGPHGLMTLPSVSFFEDESKPKKPAKKKTAGKK